MNLKGKEVSEEEAKAITRYMASKKYLCYVMLTNGKTYKVGKFHRYICEEVQRFIDTKTDEPYDILLLSVPPQHGKSITITETLPSWAIATGRAKRVIEVSYSDEFAIKFGKRNKRKIEEYGYLWGMKIDPNTSSAKDWELVGGKVGMITRGIMGGITGNPADLMIVDDPIRTREEAESFVYREKLKDEWLSSMRTRLSAGAKVIIIQTRWHPEDLIGYLLKTEDNVKYINIPCEAEEGDPLGRKVGESLVPEIGKNNKWLLGMKNKHKGAEGKRVWEALYQGYPTVREGNLIKRDNFRYYIDLPKMQLQIISVDASFKGGKENDFVALQCWGKRDNDYYLIDAVKKHMNFTQMLKEMQRFKQKHHKAKLVYIEDKANGTALIDSLKDKIDGIIPVNPKASKQERVQLILPLIDGGYVYIPKNKDFTGDFVNECASFPNGANDDQVDAMSQALNKLEEYQFVIEEKEERLFKKREEEENYEIIGDGEDINVI